jgi:hypothetical protein
MAALRIFRLAIFGAIQSLMDDADLDLLADIANDDGVLGLSSGDEPEVVVAAAVAPDAQGDADAMMQPIAAEDLDMLEQLGRRRQPRPLPEPPAWRSGDATKKARDGKAAKRRAAQEAAAAKEKAERDAELQRVCVLAPEVARALALQGPKAKRARGTREMSLDRSLFVVRAAFSARIPRGLGVRHSRLQAFACGLAMDAQSVGVAELLYKCAVFRKYAAPGEVNIATFGLSYESDSTSHGMSQHLIQTVGRPSNQRLSTEVVNQRGFSLITTGAVTANHIATQRVTTDFRPSLHAMHASRCVTLVQVVFRR